MSQISLRNINWPADRAAILAIDNSFVTERVYRVRAEASSFSLNEETLTTPLQKVYDLASEIEEFPSLDFVMLAELDGRVIGVAALEKDKWHPRALLRHIYVDRGHRGHGAGRLLMQAFLERAARLKVRYAWLETQDVNYPAIQFYKSMGFTFCGLDLSFDVHDGSPTDETAVFFMKAM